MSEHVEILRQYNVWRRGTDESVPMIAPAVIGTAIDLTIAEVERLRVVTETALTTLEQIATTPRNKGAMHNARATAMFLRTQMEQAK